MAEPMITKSTGDNAVELSLNSTGRLTFDEDASDYLHDIDVVAVHGIHGNSKDTWKSKSEDSNKTWLTEAIFNRLPWAYCHVRMLKYSYDMDERNQRAIYTRKWMRGHALQLIKDLFELREQRKIRRPIVFVAKDIGGTIIKDALYLANLNPTKFDTIVSSTRAMIFFQCPHRCSSPVDLEDELVQLLVADGCGDHRGIIEKAQSLASVVIDVNGRFIDTNLFTKVSMFNVISTAEHPSQRIFNRYTTTLQIPFEVVVEIGRSHRDLTNAPFDQDHNPRIPLALGYTPYLRLDNEIPGDLLLHGTPPLRPIRQIDYVPNHMEWISETKAFLKWKSDKVASNLHLHGSWGVSAASRYIFDLLKPDEENQGLLYYDFKPRDSRYNSIQAMLIAFINQLLIRYYRDIDMINTKIDRFLQHYHAWTREDLYFFWIELLHRKRGNAITYIINDFDSCIDSHSWFIRRLYDTIDEWERPFKFVFTDMDQNPEIQQARAGIAQSIDLNNPPELHRDHEHADHSVADSIQMGSVHSNRTLRIGKKGVNRILVACGPDESFQRLVFDWIECGYGMNEDRSMDAVFESLSSESTVALDKVLGRILSCVPLEMQHLVHQAIAWTSSAFRPLTNSEFYIILALADMGERQQGFHVALRKMTSIEGAIPKFLAGLIMIEDNEVRFSHPSVPELLIGEKALSRHDFSFEGERATHEVIAISCLSYLLLPETQIRMATFYELEDQTEEPLLDSEDYGLLQYAVLHWGNHYKRATVSARVSEKAIKFLESDASACWAKTYQALTTRVAYNDRPLPSALELVSEFGLEDLMAHFAREMKEACPAALIAAVKNSHTELALKCFGDIALTESLTHAVIMAAASSTNEGSVLKLMNYLSNRVSEAFVWPSDLLARAAWLGWGVVVNKLITSGADIDQLHALHGMAPLHLAASNNQHGIVNALLQAKAEINIRNINKATPLHMASFHGHHKIVELLTQNGADLEAKQDDDQTALEVACTSGHGKVIKFLIQASSQTLLQNPEFSGKLFAKTVERSSFTACQALLEASPKLLDHYDDECPVLVRASATDNVALVKLLAQYGAAIDAQWTADDAQGTALYYASERGSKPMVECLLQLEADPKLSFYEDRTPIYIASYNRHIEVVQLLVDKGADVNAVTTDDWGPLQIAYDSAPVTRILLEAKAEIDYVSPSGTALYLACRWNYIEVVKILLEFGAGVDILSPEAGYSSKNTPLIAALVEGNVEIVKLLLEAGANINYQNGHKNFALQCALQNEECMKTLLEYGPSLDLVDNDGDTALHCVEKQTTVSAVKRLLNAGANPEVVNNNGLTPISMSILKLNLQVMQYLISKKVKLDIISKKSGAPLHLACTKSIEYVKTLIDAGANVNLCDMEFAGTPLHRLCFRRADSPEEEKEIKQIIQLLFDNGAKVNKKGGKCRYPLHAACLRRAPDIIKFLIDMGAEVSAKDVMCWNPAQLASFRTTEHVELFNTEEYRPLFSEPDALGRTAFHYAVVSGRLDLVTRVYELSGKEVDQKDNDGWTPLMWAVRICGKWSTTTYQQADIIQFLKHQGADLWSRGEGLLGRGWSPLKVARYYDAPSHITKMLVPDSKERFINNGEARETWDRYFHITNTGIEGTGYCDGCLMKLWGISFHCLQCRDYDLCFKCYRSVKDFHHPTHSFQEVGEVKELGSDQSEDDENEEDEEDDFEEGEDGEEDALEQVEADRTEAADDDRTNALTEENEALNDREKLTEQEAEGLMSATYEQMEEEECDGRALEEDEDRFEKGEDDAMEQVETEGREEADCDEIGVFTEENGALNDREKTAEQADEGLMSATYEQRAEWESQGRVPEEDKDNFEGEECAMEQVEADGREAEENKEIGVFREENGALNDREKTPEQEAEAVINPAYEQRAEGESEGRVPEDKGAVVDDDNDHNQGAEADA